MFREASCTTARALTCYRPTDRMGYLGIKHLDFLSVGTPYRGCDFFGDVEEAALSKIRDIPLAEIDEFPDHPFKVLMDEDMEQLVDSIKRSGVMTPPRLSELLISCGYLAAFVVGKNALSLCGGFYRTDGGKCQSERRNDPCDSSAKRGRTVRAYQRSQAEKGL